MEKDTYRQISTNLGTKGQVETAGVRENNY